MQGVNGCRSWGHADLLAPQIFLRDFQVVVLFRSKAPNWRYYLLPWKYLRANSKLSLHQQQIKSILYFLSYAPSNILMKCTLKLFSDWVGILEVFMKIFLGWKYFLTHPQKTCNKLFWSTPKLGTANIGFMDFTQDLTKHHIPNPGKFSYFAFNVNREKQNNIEKNYIKSL